MLNNDHRGRIYFVGAGVMFSLSPSLGLGEAPQRLSANLPAFIRFITFNSVMMLVVVGCGGRGGQGLQSPCFSEFWSAHLVSSLHAGVIGML
jgi:hypothetical protein